MLRFSNINRLHKAQGRVKAEVSKDTLNEIPLTIHIRPLRFSKES
jgi:hypothetical protein